MDFHVLETAKWYTGIRPRTSLLQNSCNRVPTEALEHLLLLMNIHISGSHIDVTPALRDHTEEQFAKLAKVIDPNTRINVEIGKTTEHHKQGNIFKADAKIVEPKAEYFATIIAEDLYIAVDSLADELFDQVTRSKSRHRALLRRGHAMIKKLLRF